MSKTSLEVVFQRFNRFHNFMAFCIEATTNYQRKIEKNLTSKLDTWYLKTD